MSVRTESREPKPKLILVLTLVLLIVAVPAFLIVAGATSAEPPLWAWLLVVIFPFVILCVMLPLLEIRTLKDSLFLEGNALAPGFYDEDRFRKYSDCLEAVSIGAGAALPEIRIVDTPAPLAYTADSDGHFIFAITKDLLEAELNGAEMEAVAAALLARTFFYPGSFLRKEVRELEVDRDVMKEVRISGANPYRINFLVIILADTCAARLTGQPAALRSAIVKCAGMLESRRVRLRDVDFDCWCGIFVGPPIAGFESMWSRQWRKIVKLRMENLEAIEAGKWHPSYAILDRMPESLQATKR